MSKRVKCDSWEEVARRAKGKSFRIHSVTSGGLCTVRIEPGKIGVFIDCPAYASPIEVFHPRDHFNLTINTYSFEFQDDEEVVSIQANNNTTPVIYGKSHCTCDFQETIMRTGCVCGAIKRYGT